MLNHKLFVCISGLLLAVLLANVNAVEEPQATLIKEVNEQNLNGAGLFKSQVEVTNGISQSSEGDVNGIKGEYLLPGRDGEPPVRVTYRADASGFHADVHEA
ncbi:uncharacterized protein LOC133843455 [Drosophila sulfurigaster albostrigata]|uniref:uncharacterized protein LOC133843455 n=1 Tax=Drosophila sulfurigaster albostrigata TaxID=89887 RepID=UPI002D21AF0A|nr:uncharacterized protein LOC133843455 [Drosophila sulfurigaster albostrigata]